MSGRAARTQQRFDFSLPGNQKKLDVIEELDKLSAEAGVPLIHLALAFVLTEGPEQSPVVLELTSTHGVHGSDVPIILLWLVGVSALGALAWRRRTTPTP